MFDSRGPVLGIDPGVSCCGYGAVLREGPEIRAVSYGVIRTSPADPLPQRLAQLATEIENLVRELSPRAMAVERVLFQNNARTAISVGQANGLALVAAARAGVPVEQYSPNEVKLAVAGHGAADKEQVQLMVTRLLHLGQVPKPPDAADALALALCHEWAGPLRDRTASDPVAVGAAGSTALDRAVAAAIARDAR